MNMGNIKCAVVGVGNCFAGLVQGIEYYKQHPEQKVIGIMHESMAGYTIHDIEFVCGFDVGENKIGKTINEAIYESPNLVNWIPKDKMAKTNEQVFLLFVREDSIGNKRCGEDHDDSGGKYGKAFCWF